MKSSTIPTVLMILLASNSVSAQTKAGFTAGASFANVTVKSQGVSASPKGKAGITAGFFLDAPIGVNFSCQPAVNFIQKGYTIKDETGSEKVIFNYLEVPVNFVYSTKKNGGFFIGAGPSVAYGISGKDKFSYSGGGMPPETDKIQFGTDGEDVKTFDFGANVLAGYRFKDGFMISGNYNPGLSKINNDDGSGSDGAIKNRYFAVKIGYIFNSNKKK